MNTDDDASVLNSPDYWDMRFRLDWDQRGGPEQTAFFANLALSILPTWIADDIRDRRLSILDFGCAEGEALPVLINAFPNSQVTGGDVSTVAIELARKRYSQLTFRVLEASNPSVSADVLFCSNTIEHFRDWRSKLDEIARCARQHLIVLAPFRETEPLADEHMAVFDFDGLPAQLPGALRLQHVSVRTTSELPGSRWVGKQFLAIWSSGELASTKSTQHIGDLDDIDFRHVPVDAISQCLRLAAGSFAKLDTERAERARIAKELDAQKQASKFRLVTLENQLIETRVGLENTNLELMAAIRAARNELIETRVSLDNELIRTRVSLENELIETRVGLENENLELAAALNVARNDATEIRVTSENKLIEVQVGLENKLIETRVGLENEKLVLAAALSAACKEAADIRVASENKLIEVQAGLEKKLIETRVGLENANSELKAALANAQAEISELKACLESERIAAKEFIRDAKAARATSVAVEAASNAAMTQLERNYAVTLSKAADQFNAHVTARERAIQATLDKTRQSYTRLTSMRSFRLMMQALQRIGHLRGQVVAQPHALERVTVALERFDPMTVLSSMKLGAPSAQQRATAGSAALRRSRDLAKSDRLANGTLLLQLSALDRGDVSRVVCDLAIAWMSDGWDVVVVAMEQRGTDAARLKANGVRVEVLGSWDDTAYRAVVGPLKIKAAFLHQNLDGVAILAGVGVPIIEIIHGEASDLLKDASAYRTASAVVSRRIALSAVIADDYAALTGISRTSIDVMGMPINSDDLVRPETRLLDYARRNWKSEFVFVSVAPMDDTQAHAALLKAFAHVHKSNPQTRLRLISTKVDDATQEMVRNWVDGAKLNAAIELIGPVDDRRLSQYLASSHVFVSLAVAAGHSVGRLQAIHFKLPMILNASGDAKVLVQDGTSGILVPGTAEIVGGSIAQQVAVDQGQRFDPAVVRAMEAMIADYETWQRGGHAARPPTFESSLEQLCEQYRAAPRVLTGQNK
jgi:SAM-dependent methyltransferase/glycosyltransferase involved in cell wall biosynthesis